MKISLILNEEEVKAEDKLNSLLNTIKDLIIDGTEKKKPIKTMNADTNTIIEKYLHKTISVGLNSNDKIIDVDVKEDFFIDCVEMISSVTPLIKSIITTLTDKITKIMERWTDPYFQYKRSIENNYLVKVYDIKPNLYKISVFVNESDLDKFVKYTLGDTKQQIVEIINLWSDKNITVDTILRIEI